MDSYNFRPSGYRQDLSMRQQSRRYSLKLPLFSRISASILWKAKKSSNRPPQILRGSITYAKSFCKGLVGREGVDLRGEFCYEALLQVILLLHQSICHLSRFEHRTEVKYYRPKAEGLLPKFWAYAMSPDIKRCVPAPHRMQVFTTLVSPCVIPLCLYAG